MANPAAQARAKMQARWLGASVYSRGKSWIRHQHLTESARFSYDTQVGACWHFGDGPYSEADEVDTAWQTTTGAWDYEMTLNDFQTYARDTFNAGDIFEFQAQGESIRLDPQSINWVDENNSRQQIAIKQAVTATVDDDKLIFTDAYGMDIHFSYQNQTSSLQKLITIDSFAAIDTTLPAGNTIWFEVEFSLALSSGIDFYLDGQLWTRGNNVRVKTVNNIEVRDAVTGTQTLCYLRSPNAEDSVGNEVVGEMEVRRQGGQASLFITIRIPKNWIDSATFPIFIDPTIDESIAASADDAHEKANESYFTSTENYIYHDASADAGARYYAGYRFGVSDIAKGDTIDTAYFETVAKSTDVDDANADLSAHDVDASLNFSDDADVVQRALTDASVAFVQDSVGAGGWGSAIEIKTVIQEIVDRPSWDESYITLIVVGRSDTFKAWQVYGYDKGNAGNYPTIHIEYTAAVTGPQINISPDANYIQIV